MVVRQSEFRRAQGVPCRRLLRRNYTQLARPFFIPLGLLVSSCTSFGIPDPTPTPPLVSAIKVGMLSANPRESTEKTQPFADEVARRLQPNEPVRGEVWVASTLSGIVELLRTDAVDLYVDSPFPAIAAADQSGGTAFLRRWKRDQPTYHSVVFVRADSGIQSPRDLLGKTIALQDPESTSSFMLPRIMLYEAGIRLQPSEEPGGPIPVDQAQYVFSKEDENTVAWVLRHKVDAGATDEASLRTFAGNELPSLRILMTSPDVPRHVIVHRPGLPEAQVRSLAQILTSMHQDDAGRAALAAFDNTSRIDNLPPDTVTTIRELQRVAAQL